MWHSVQCTDPSVFVVGFALLLVLGALRSEQMNKRQIQYLEII